MTPTAVRQLIEAGTEDQQLIALEAIVGLGTRGGPDATVAVTSCLGSCFINIALTALRSIHRMDARCDMAVVAAVATSCCENRSDRVRHVAAQTLKEVCDNDGVRKTNGYRQTAYMGCAFSKAAEQIIAGFDMDGTKMIASR